MVMNSLRIMYATIVLGSLTLGVTSG